MKANKKKKERKTKRKRKEKLRSFCFFPSNKMKVRIYTTVALRIPSCLVDYANQFNVVQNSVIVALIQV